MPASIPIRRRSVLAIGGGLAATLAFPAGQLFAETDMQRRFVFIIQRGAADGLNTLIPFGDPALVQLRGRDAAMPDGLVKLDGTFALHPSLANVAALYRKGQASFVHAVASRYRERSHFDAQNLLENGASEPYARDDGWLNRLVGMIPATGPGGVAIAPVMPLALRGPASATSFAPSYLHIGSSDVIARAGELYASDPALAAAWQAAMATQDLVPDGNEKDGPAALGKIAAGFLAKADGPRIAMLEIDGWDTHLAQAPRLGGKLTQLDRMIAGLQEGLGTVWNDTVVVVATEFGRTAAFNGTAGTDHGTGSVAMLLGGAVRGGRIVSDWPGLRQQDLLEARDLRPTMSLENLIASAAAQTFGLDPEKTGKTLFGMPATVDGLVA